MEYRKAEAPDRYPWTQVGISERRYYKLLPLFAEKVNGRYALDHDDVVARMKAYLDRADHVREVRAAALDVLRSHGFGEEAARKWLQRHRPSTSYGLKVGSPAVAQRMLGRALIGIMHDRTSHSASTSSPGWPIRKSKNSLGYPCSVYNNSARALSLGPHSVRTRASPLQVWA
jgi:hypothetical protein